MFDKQLDSGKATLLHLCDDVIQQEVGSRFNKSCWTKVQVMFGKYLVSKAELCRSKR